MLMLGGLVRRKNVDMKRGWQNSKQKQHIVKHCLLTAFMSSHHWGAKEITRLQTRMHFAHFRTLQSWYFERCDLALQAEY